MINLLPPEIKDAYRYARRNYHLIRWVGVFGVALIVSVLLTVGGVIYIRSTTTNYQQQVASTTAQLKAQDLPAVQKQVTNISNNLELVVKVLSKEVLFSQLLQRLGSVTPPNVIFTNLAISQTQGAIDITAETADYNTATQLQINLADPKNQIFAKADIISIACSATSATPNYPCTATIRALFAANNPFLFISSGAKTK